MADFTSETVTRTIYRWVVPAAEPWGAAAAEIGKAWAVAELAYREAHGLDPAQPLHDDALRFHVRDEAVVIEFQTETPAP
ncbi:hypothetical protein [Streptomyces hirsutus]|uniref:hypothetical protein n=1 Tax=Streptomyces hirsutus TaxID=35620 RepID=UPI0036CA8DEB